MNIIELSEVICKHQKSTSKIIEDYTQKIDSEASSKELENLLVELSENNQELENQINAKRKVNYEA